MHAARPGRSAITILTGAALVAVGCGGEESDESKVRSVAHVYLQAAAEGDGDKACATISPDGLRKLAAQIVKDTSGQASTCKDGIELTAKQLEAGTRKRARTTSFDVKVSGNRATASYDQPVDAVPNVIALEKTGGRWLITDTDG